jgi:CBS domain-containing protein
MTPFPWFIHIEDRLGRAAEVMAERDIRHLPVTEDGELVGVLAERDLQLVMGSAASPEQRASLTVRDACVLDAYVVETSEPLDRVLLTMARRHIGSALVVKNGKLAGGHLHGDRRVPLLRRAPRIAIPRDRRRHRLRAVRGDPAPARSTFCEAPPIVRRPSKPAPGDSPMPIQLLCRKLGTTQIFAEDGECRGRRVYPRDGPRGGPEHRGPEEDRGKGRLHGPSAELRGASPLSHGPTPRRSLPQGERRAGLPPSRESGRSSRRASGST